MSFARVSRFAETNSLSRSFWENFLGWVHSDVPEETPKVWFPDVPFVVAWKAWSRLESLALPLKSTVPRPQPVLLRAVPISAAKAVEAKTRISATIPSVRFIEFLPLQDSEKPRLL